MNFFEKNAIPIKEIKVNDTKGDDKPKIARTITKHLILLFMGIIMIDYCLEVHCLEREYPNY
jgi:hypothetical protein